MPESEALVNPYWVQYHSNVEGEDTGLAFPMLVVHENDGEHVDGWVLVNDERNTAGLSNGLNWRSNIGKGGPGSDASWSPMPTS
jgi:hypothetical protein